MGLVTENLAQFLDPLPGGKNVTNAVDFVANWARANSLWPLVYGTSCCAIEMMATGSSKHDWSRFGTEVARATPRQADLIILAGTIVEKMVPRLRTLYDQMPSPKYVIAMGACTISGGPFYYDSYYVVKGADRIIPVDVFVPGCPPRPEALLYGIMELQKKIKGESLRNPITEEHLVNTPWNNKHGEAEAIWKEEQDKYLIATKQEREKFKEENPDFKAYKHTKKVKEKFEAVERVVIPQSGLSKKDVLIEITSKFPNLELYQIGEINDENIEKIGTEQEVDLVVQKDQYSALINFLKSNTALDCDFLLQLTCVDWEDHFDIIVQLMSSKKGHKVFIRCPIERNENSELETISEFYLSANWHEREVFDFFGVKFTSHPDLRRLFLTDDFEGYPMRKDFVSDKIVKRSY